MHFIITVLLILLPLTAPALGLETTITDTNQEQRAQLLFKEIRCIVCSGQSIADSRVELAKDLRAVIRTKILEGYNNQEILAYVSGRYGEGILMQPPFQTNTYLLWFSPILILFIGIIGIIVYLKRN
jgi:cytochrome c-type biogenesis protein CcmH